MKKTLFRVLSLCLAVIMAFGLCTAAFADGGKQGFEHYLMIGDSIAVYCGDPPKSDYIPVYFDPSLTFKGTYSDRLKSDHELGINSICSCAHPGWRVQDAIFALGGENRTADYMLKFAGDTVSRISEYSPAYVRGLKEADLISINLGNNNIMQPFVYALYTAFEKEGIAFDGSCADKLILDCLKRLQADFSDVEALAKLLSVLETTERGIALVKNALRMLPQAARDFQKSWDDLIALITTANPDAKIVVLSAYNPVGGAVEYNLGGSVLSSGLAAMLKTATDPSIATVNAYMRSGSKYSDRYVFVDVTNPDLTGTKDGVHLGDVGHQFFYTQMKNAIKTNFMTDSAPTQSASLLDRMSAAFRSFFGFIMP